MFTTLALNTILAITPAKPIPADLEVCVLRAEVCALQNECSEDAPESAECLETLVKCAHQFPAYFESCRVTYAWCLLDPPSDPESFTKFCSGAFKTCPTY